MKAYDKPALEVLELSVQDAIRTSTNTDPAKQDLDSWDLTIGQ